MADLSVTGISTYMGCARKFKFQRVDKWEYAGVYTPGPMELGSLVHYLVDKRLNGMSVLDAPERAKEWIDEKYDNDFSRSTAYKEHYAYALAMSNYVIEWLERNKFFDKWEIVSIETEYTAQITDDFQLRFWPDILVRHRTIGHYGVIDFKTAKTLQNTLHAGDWQMLGMAVGLEALGMTPYYAAHIKVKKVKTTTAKPPLVDIHELRFTPERLKVDRENLIEIARRVDSDLLFLPSPDWTCSTMCAFKQPCEAMSSGQDWEYVMMQTHRRPDKEKDEQ